MAAVKINSAVIYQYSLPLSKPLVVRNRILKRREGLILYLSDSEGCEGFGEIAPLPGLNKESLASAKKQILSGIKQPLYPSVQFGLETAWLSLVVHRQNKMLCELLSKTHRDTVEINALLDGSLKEVCVQAAKKIKKGFRSFKLKVGRGPLDTDIQKVRTLEKIFNSKATLRLDANRAWDWDTAINFAKRINTHIIDYIEEPLADSRRLSDFYSATQISFAFDESLVNVKLEKLRAQAGLKAVILKPTVLGGLFKTMEWIRRAESLGIQPIISSAFETCIGLAALTHLAACTRGNFPVGLDTRQWFKNE